MTSEGRGRNSMLTLERLRFTFTPNGRREFVPRDQFFPYFPFTFYCFYSQISSFMTVLTIGIVGDCFYLLNFYSEKFSTWVWRVPFAVNVHLHLSTDDVSQHWVLLLIGRTGRKMYFYKQSEALPTSTIFDNNVEKNIHYHVYFKTRVIACPSVSKFASRKSLSMLKAHKTRRTSTLFFWGKGE